MKKLIETRPNAALTSLVLGFAAAASAIAADLKVPADYPTIQAAVDAADTNDTIQIAPGVYTNQVQIISKKLTLIGQPGTVLRAHQAMSSFPSNLDVPIVGILYSEVTVRGLTFEGERLAGRSVSRGELKGILLQQSSGNVENCAFYGFRERASRHEFAFPILVSNEDANEVNVRVVGNTFADSYGGIYLIGSPTKKSINVTIQNNTISGLGPRDNGYNYSGIEVQHGVGGRIAGNTISGFSYVGTAAEYPISFGILASDTGAFRVLPRLEIEGNTLRDNQEHIALVNVDNSVIRNNRFQGTAPGILPLGLILTGTNVTIANNQFEDMPEGIRLVGDDPRFGTSLGITIGAQVTSNRFCNVTIPVNLEPLASAVQAATLICPFPPPTLAITPAVLLSWPLEDDGWTVESSPLPDGPWTAPNATPFMQDARHSIAVPTDDAHRFFRLH